MTWTYDLARDVLSVTYGRPERPVARTIGSGDAVLYLDEGGGAIRAEIIRAGQRHNMDILAVGAGHPDWVPLQAAAERFGVKVYALREEILSGGMPSAKTGHSWQVREAVLEVYREILQVRRAADRP